MYKVLLWDIDGTLLNFKEAEFYSLQNCFHKYHLGELTRELCQVYAQINDRYWQKLERNEIAKKDLLVERFKEFFTSMHYDFNDYVNFNHDYQLGLGDHIFFNDDSYSLILDLKPHFKQYAVTNGTYTAQSKKLAKSHLNEALDGAFISDLLKVEKPNHAFFEKVLDTVGSANKQDYLIIGDSLTSDIQGGNNIGIDTCFYDPSGNIDTADYNVKYHIHDLNELRQILEID